MIIKICNYNVIIEEKISKKLDSYIEKGSKVLIVLDSNVKFKSKHKTYNFVATEQNKSKEGYDKLISYLIDNDFSKDDYIIAIGGGITCDLVSYVAATYKRGMKHILVPTTTLAMCDASIGSKCAINYHGIKNSLGTFYDPCYVLIDFCFLKTLDKRHYKEGLYEAYKCGFIKDPSIFEAKDNEKIIKAILVKKEFIEKDYYDQNIRHALNFGHTIGHALEVASNYTIEHGRAIAIGMYYEIDRSLRKEYKKIVKRLNINIDEYKNDIYKYISNDKKVSKKHIFVPRVHKIGCYEIESMTINQFLRKCKMKCQTVTEEK